MNVAEPTIAERQRDLAIEALRDLDNIEPGWRGDLCRLEVWADIKKRLAEIAALAAPREPDLAEIGYRAWERFYNLPRYQGPQNKSAWNAAYAAMRARDPEVQDLIALTRFFAATLAPTTTFRGRKLSEYLAAFQEKSDG